MAIDKHTQCTTLPRNFCKITAPNSMNELINEVFLSIAQNYKNQEWFSVRALLAAKNNDISVINFCIQDTIPD